MYTLHAPGLAQLGQQEVQVGQSGSEVWGRDATVPPHLRYVLIQQKHPIVELQLLPFLSSSVQGKPKDVSNNEYFVFCQLLCLFVIVSQEEMRMVKE